MDTSKLTERLRALVVPGSRGASVAIPVVPGISRTSQKDAVPSLEAALGGRWEEGRARCFVVERSVPADAVHGSMRVDECAAGLERAMTYASLLMRRAPAQSPFLFFDLETTGLSGGAGTYAFLIGCGWFGVDGSFVTRQYFLADGGGERSLLEAVTGDLDRAGVLVSFNGKSFDVPLLEARHLFHRLEWSRGAMPHLDLLHPARRFWGSPHAPDCSLGALERTRAGVQRREDVPGFEIPARYFQFVRTGDAGPLSGVLEHNRQDLLSLAVLTARLLQLVEAGSSQTEDAREALGLGHVYASSGADSRAREAYRRAVALTTPTSGSSTSPRLDDTALRIAALRASALAERRARAYDAAADCWQRLLDLPDCPLHVAGEALEALAIHHEHRVRDLVRARTFALSSLKSDRRPAWNDAVRHRLARLDRKLERLTEPSLFPSWPSPPPLFCGSPTSAPRTSS